MDESKGILDLPFEIIACIIENLDYKSINNLLCVSSGFYILYRNPVIWGITISKKPDIVGRIMRRGRIFHDNVILRFPNKFITPFSPGQLDTMINLRPSEVDKVEKLVGYMKRNESFKNENFGCGVLRFSEPMHKSVTWMIGGFKNYGFSVAIKLDKVIIQRLLEEFVKMVRNDEYCTVIIYVDRTVLKMHEHE